MNAITAKTIGSSFFVFVYNSQAKYISAPVKQAFNSTLYHTKLIKRSLTG